MDPLLHWNLWPVCLYVNVVLCYFACLCPYGLWSLLEYYKMSTVYCLMRLMM
jgi:hypothetical protein